MDKGAFVNSTLKVFDDDQRVEGGQTTTAESIIKTGVGWG